jgi:hypothetical protein
MPCPLPLDFDAPDSVEIHNWRRHLDLHRWTEWLSREKGGKDENFNCVNVALTRTICKTSKLTSAPNACQRSRASSPEYPMAPSLRMISRSSPRRERRSRQIGPSTTHPGGSGIGRSRLKAPANATGGLGAITRRRGAYMPKAKSKRPRFELPSVRPGYWRGEILGGCALNFGQVVQPGRPRQSVEFTYMVIPAAVTMHEPHFTWPGIIMMMVPAPMKTEFLDAGHLFRVERLEPLDERCDTPLWRQLAPDG